MTKKITIDDITPDKIEQAQEIVAKTVLQQTQPPNVKLGLAVIHKLCGDKVSLRTSLGVRLDASLRDSLHASLDDSLDESLDDSLSASLRASLYDSLRASLNASLNGQVKFNYCGIFWSWWLARYLIAYAWGCPLDKEKLALLAAFCEHAPLTAVIKTEKAQHLIILAKPKHIAWVKTGMTQGPIPLPRYELHADGEVAVDYPGIPLYFWHNTRIPEKYGAVRSEQWKSEWLLEEDNAELRRILIEGIGYARMVSDLGGKVLHKDNGNELIRIDQDIDVEPIFLLKVICPSTGGMYALRVPPGMETCEQAREWTFGEEKLSLVRET